MIVSAIAAMDRSGLIGNGSKMPWHLPRDLRRFRDLTLKKPIVLGRRTLESLAAPLPGRLSIVLTRNNVFRAAGCSVAKSINEALRLAEEYTNKVGGNEVMIIGGGEVFKATTSLWDRLYLTVIEGDFQGDVYFPLEQIKELSWQIADSTFCEPDNKNSFAHWFLTLERVRTDPDPLQAFDLFRWLSNPMVPSENRSV